MFIYLENWIGLEGTTQVNEEEDVNAVTVSSTALGCYSNGDFYANGADIVTEDPCEHCYCLNGDMVCAVQECMGPLEGETDSCEPLPAPPGQCCPAEYNCRKYFNFLNQHILILKVFKYLT